MRNFLIVGCMLALLTACGSSVKLDPASVEDKNAKGVPKG
ncbi:MAG: peptidoglycan-associated lipoprotein, partial [Betaproteobacteria bacterium]|nr:peptidoglycan-associated lipoprotein [Betaproteobacteria bacterium]